MDHFDQNSATWIYLESIIWLWCFSWTFCYRKSGFFVL